MPLAMNREVFITCAVTGSGGTQDRSPHVPRSPAQIAASAIDAAKAGAAVVHCHVRDPETGKRYLLGSLPRMDAKAGMLALESAERAFQQGQGEWPSASTAQRVAAAETFIKAMLAVRTEVVDLLMWETVSAE